MGFPWKSVFTIVRHIAEPLVPGAEEADAAIQAAIDAKSDAARADAIFDAAVSGLGTLVAIKPELIADPALLKEGIVEAHDAAAKIQKALRAA